METAPHPLWWVRSGRPGRISPAWAYHCATDRLAWLDNQQGLAVLYRLAVQNQDLDHAPSHRRLDLAQQVQRLDGGDDLPLPNFISRSDQRLTRVHAGTKYSYQRRADLHAVATSGISFSGVGGKIVGMTVFFNLFWPSTQRWSRPAKQELQALALPFDGYFAYI